MKAGTVLGIAAGLVLGTALAVTPAGAATNKTSSAPPVADAVTQPAGNSAECPVMTPSPALSDTTQGLFALIADACKLRKAGLIEEYQFESIRDQAVNDILVEMQAEASARMNTSLAVVP